MFELDLLTDFNWYRDMTCEVVIEEYEEKRYDFTATFHSEKMNFHSIIKVTFASFSGVTDLGYRIKEMCWKHKIPCKFREFAVYEYEEKETLFTWEEDK